MKNRRLTWGTAALSIGALALTASCGKKSSDDDTASTATSTTSAVAENPAAAAYPGSLSVTAFPNSTAALTLADDKTTAPNAKAEAEDQAKRLKGGADVDCRPGIFKNAEGTEANVSCYEFDQEMIAGTNPSGKTYGTLDGTDGNGEACLVSFARAQTLRVKQPVQRTQGMMEAALCARKKAGATDLPAAGASIDLKANLVEAMGPIASSITSVTLSRRAADVDGKPVYDFTVTKFKMKNGREMTATITHSPQKDDNSEYVGILSMKEVGGTTGAKAGESEKTNMLSVKYVRSVGTDGKTTVSYEARRGQFATSLVASAFDANGLVDFNAGAAFTAASTSNDYGKYTGFAQANDAVSGMTYIAFSGNPDDDSGTFSFWVNPGGNFRESARGMVAKLTVNAAGELEGESFSGAARTSTDGISIRSALKETDGTKLVPNGAYHPFFNTATSPNCTAATGPTADATSGRKTYNTTCGSQAVKWYTLAATTTGATNFVTLQQPSEYTKQAFKRNSAGVYKITTTGTDGYELVTGTAGLPTPPKPTGAKDLPKTALVDLGE